MARLSAHDRQTPVNVFDMVVLPKTGMAGSVYVALDTE